jgi:arylsulfatase A-like enzyme
MYGDPGYFLDSVSRGKSILGKIDPTNVTYDVYNQLTVEERLAILVYHMLEKSNIKFEKGVGAIANREMLSHLKEWPNLPEFPKQHQLLVDSYDAGIKYTDRFLGKFFSFLKSQDLWTNTMLVVTSDHGEEFMEHNMVGHLLDLYDTLLHVPLIVKMPKSRRYTNKRVSSLAEIVDIMPTILDVLDISFEGQMQGKSLLPYLSENKRERGNSVFASLDNRFKEKKRVVRTSDWKYMISDGDFSDEDEFYHVEKDRLEQKNLIDVETEDMRRLRSILADHIRKCMNLYQTYYSKNRKTQDEYPEEIRKKRMDVLRALGYIK